MMATRSLQVNIYNDPFLALSGFKPNYYDLMLIDINMPKINGIELSRQLLELDSMLRYVLLPQEKQI